MCNVQILQILQEKSSVRIVCNRSQWPRGLRRRSAGNAGSNPAGGMDVCLLWVLCVVRWRSLRRADLSSRGVLPSVYMCVCHWMGPGATTTLYTYSELVRLVRLRQEEGRQTVDTVRVSASQTSCWEFPVNYECHSACTKHNCRLMTSGKIRSSDVCHGQMEQKWLGEYNTFKSRYM
jgi:hypothetical protein